NENIVNPVQIIPNPTADWVQISVDGFPGGSSADVLVYDGRGLLVHRAKMNPGGSYSIDLSTWPVGVYSVLINGDRFNLAPTRVIKN
ncbi:MAG: T9SS type A sorting domain-containing protein, partial [Bacteroidota bacterium]